MGGLEIPDHVTSGIAKAEWLLQHDTLRRIRIAAVDAAAAKCLRHGDVRSELVYKEADILFETLCREVVEHFKKPLVEI